MASRLFPILLISFHGCFGQYVLSGKVVQSSTSSPLEDVKILTKPGHLQVKTDKLGIFRFALPAGAYQLSFYHTELKTVHIKLTLEKDTFLTVSLDSLSYELQEVEVQTQGSGVSSMDYLKTVEGTAIYEGKKNEVILMKEVTANLATNNARQVFGKVPGLNIWESDCAGLQLDIGARGLSPNRTANFNTRQNGYDISADALGYPESYYTPPLEAVERIEIVRGAASLQYGTQFGGLLNFKLKQGANKPLEIVSRQTLASYQFFNSFNSLAGTKERFSYYTFYQHKQGNCWRPYSSFNLNMAYGSVSYKTTEKLTLTAEYTGLRYVTQMPGGLTDSEFMKDPAQSLRTRNWFQVNWNLFALYADLKISPRTTFNTRFFGIYSGRDALGNLERITRPDNLQSNRNLLSDVYSNIGNETRLLHRYTIGSHRQVFVVGFRAYIGNTSRKQGDADNGTGPNFSYLYPDALENSDYKFPGKNLAAFAEHVFYLSDKLSITPGMRLEYIRTDASGYYTNTLTDGAGNVIFSEQTNETRSRERNFLLFGLGIAYKHREWAELYANASQNYRAITFSDIRVVNPNYGVDPNIQDEKGYTVDLGSRGHFKHLLQYDISVYYMNYSGRIGEILKEGGPPTYLPFRYRTNVSDSRTYGVEAFSELDLFKAFYRTSKVGVPVFGSIALNDARYVHSENLSIENKYVELVPRMLLRLGAGVKWKDLRINYQYSYIGQQYTDASNATIDPNAVIGIIPAYGVMDLSAKYTFKWIGLETGINNLANLMYFTRRADGYPGPGIIPSPSRTWYLTLQVKI